ncbi:hypothetical protein B0T26DRAFT_730363 [Lasiosphaeria miniovina]|uniref:Uncharacterized protein n=1 Tax=Lasiosphaeria miniovina TaxID=1954250 RepID=A0AA39ZT83_9PEZI|nr:uncharacterized protein B0T26DRAFT_730363 [Lasiosphaeria miniovina]KAK0703229.1 hypothetical protein B0T26DRAFT_730363 [Lasiosphaeria miniovina]
MPVYTRSVWKLDISHAVMHKKCVEARYSCCYAQEVCRSSVFLMPYSRSVWFSKEFSRKVIQRYDADVCDADKDVIFNSFA